MRALAFTNAAWLTLVALGAACVEGRLYAAPVAAGDGRWMELRSARAFEDRIEIVVRLENTGREPLDVDLSAWRLVTPDALILTPAARRAVRLRARADLALIFRHDRPQLTDAPGFWLVPGGLRDSRGPVHLPAMPLGHPITPPPADGG